MRGVNGCLVCGMNYRANDRHSCDELDKAMQRLRDKHHKALITVEDMGFVTSELQEETNSEEQDVAAQWAQEDEFSKSEIAFIVSCDQRDV